MGLRNVPLEGEITWSSDFVRRAVGRVPAVRGNWFAASAALRVLPKAMRRVVAQLGGVNGVKIEFDVADPTQFSMISNPQLDLMTGAVIWQLLSEGDTFVDVGTNFGYFTTIAARRVGSGGLVVGVEANRRAYSTLLSTLSRHGLSNVVAVHYAAAEVEGQRVSVVRPFYRQTAKSYIASPAEGRNAEDSEVVTISVDRLLEWVQRGPVKLIKIDTEGAELPVLKGARKLLQEQRPSLIVEVSAEFSRRFGYQIAELYAFLARDGYSRAYMIVDDSGNERLIGPLARPTEGQILFIRDCEQGVEADQAE